MLKGIGLTTKILENAIVNSGGTVDPGQTGIAQLHAQITRLRDEKIQEQPARWRNDKWWVYVRPDGRCTVPEILRSLSVEAQQAQRELYIQKSRIRRARQNISLRIGKPVRGGKQPQQSRKPNITYNAITRPGQPSYTVLENDPMSLNADMRKNATQGPGEKRGTWHVNQNRGQQPPDQMTPEEFAEFTELVAGQCGQTAQEFFRHNVENESINTGISVETLAQQKNYNNEQMQWLELPSLGVGPWENASTETYVEPSGEEAQLSKESEAELLETDENEADSTKVLEARLEAELEAELLGSQVSEADSTKDLESRLQAELEAELLAMSHQSYAIPQAGTAEPLAIGGEVNKLSKDLEYDLFGDGS